MRTIFKNITKILFHFYNFKGVESWNRISRNYFRKNLIDMRGDLSLISWQSETIFHPFDVKEINWKNLLSLENCSHSYVTGLTLVDQIMWSVIFHHLQKWVEPIVNRNIWPYNFQKISMPTTFSFIIRYKNFTVRFFIPLDSSFHSIIAVVSKCLRYSYWRHPSNWRLASVWRLRETRQ